MNTRAHEPIAASDQQHRLEPKSGARWSSGPGWRESSRSPREADPREDLRGALMDMYASAVPQRPCGGSNARSTSIVRVGSSVPRAASVCPRATLAISRPPRFTATRWPATCHGLFLVVNLHAAYLGRHPTGQQREVVALGNLAADERAGHDRPEATHAERPIDRQAGGAIARARRDVSHEIAQCVSESVETGASRRRHRHDGRICQREIRRAARRRPAARAPASARSRGRPSTMRPRRARRRADGRCPRVRGSAA